MHLQELPRHVPRAEGDLNSTATVLSDGTRQARRRSGRGCGSSHQVYSLERIVVQVGSAGEPSPAEERSYLRGGHVLGVD